jgi:GntR family transcriptional regulator/MocR family aminotransferase
MRAPELACDFRPCVPDLERLPNESWRRSLVRTAHHLPSTAFDYADPAGSPSLREAIAGYLARARGVRCTAEEVVIVGGVAQALDLAARLFLDPGDAVLLEDPHYLGARRSFEVAGARLVGAPVDADGLDLSGLDPADARACRLAYVTPSHQFPTGSVLSLVRRQELLRWAEAQNGFILEDDYDSEFRYAGRAIEALKSLDQGGRVLYTGTFSKTLFPSLRIAYLVLPPSVAPLFRSARWLSDWAAPTLEQEALARFLESGDFERHLRRARTLYAESREALLKAIEAELGAFEPTFRDSHAGLHLLIRFPGLSGQRLPELLSSARSAGLGLYPAAPCYLGPGPEALELILGFARLGGASIRAGVGTLRSLLDGLAAGDPLGSGPSRARAAGV